MTATGGLGPSRRAAGCRGSCARREIGATVRRGGGIAAGAQIAAQDRLVVPCPGTICFGQVTSKHGLIRRRWSVMTDSPRNRGAEPSRGAEPRAGGPVWPRVGRASARLLHAATRLFHAATRLLHAATRLLHAATRPHALRRVRAEAGASGVKVLVIRRLGGWSRSPAWPRVRLLFVRHAFAPPSVALVHRLSKFTWWPNPVAPVCPKRSRLTHSATMGAI